MKVLLVGSSGLVGQQVLARALGDSRFSQVIALTRRALPPHPQLSNPVVDFANLPEDADWWAVDGVICTLGTTLKQAGSKAAFRVVDHDYPLAVARLAKARGATRFALNSSLGADAASYSFYTRTKGEVEAAIQALGFRSLTIVRPGLIGGERSESRPVEQAALFVLRVLGPLVPRRYRINPAERIAEALLEGCAEGQPGTRIVSSEELNG